MGRVDRWSLPIKLGIAGIGVSTLVGLGIIARSVLGQPVPTAWIVATTVLFVASLGVQIAHTVRIEIGVSSGNVDDDDDEATDDHSIVIGRG